MKEFNLLLVIYDPSLSYEVNWDDHHNAGTFPCIVFYRVDLKMTIKTQGLCSKKIPQNITILLTLGGRFF